MQQRPDNFRVLKILHLALLGGLTILAIASLALLLQDSRQTQDEVFERILQGIAVVLSLGTLLFGFNFFKKKITAIRNSTGTATIRMEKYRAACIAWWAMIEGPGLFAIISFMLTGNYAFFALGLFHITLLAVFMPRKENIILLLNLTSEEVDALEGGK